eukprot:COSAG02_NODE_21068_length_804_cov_1.053901_1_plen_36_part_10
MELPLVHGVESEPWRGQSSGSGRDGEGTQADNDPPF